MFHQVLYKEEEARHLYNTWQNFELSNWNVSCWLVEKKYALVQYNQTDYLVSPSIQSQLFPQDHCEFFLLLWDFKAGGKLLKQM